jgi:hypothetical protein
LSAGGIGLYWLPLGAGGRFVRMNGRIYETGMAIRRRRRPLDLYHSALEVGATSGRYVVEVTPVAGAGGETHGAVREGPVGTQWAGRMKIFRYEVRCWPNGSIPDVEEAVESPRHLTEDPNAAQRLLDLAPAVPGLIWGRDQLGTGDMWNSNSVISWLLVRSGIDITAVNPPAGGRAPGWQAGIEVATRISGCSHAASPEATRGQPDQTS